MYEQVLIKKTVYGAGENQILCGDGSSLPSEIMTKAGQIQCVYLDPPFMTGKVFRRKRPWGEKDGDGGIPVWIFQDIWIAFQMKKPIWRCFHG